MSHNGTRNQDRLICTHICTSVDGFLGVLMRVTVEITVFVRSLPTLRRNQRPRPGYSTSLYPSHTYPKFDLLLPGRWKQKVCPKCWQRYITTHDVTSHTIANIFLTLGIQTYNTPRSLLPVQCELNRSCGQHGRHALRHSSSAWWSCVIVESRRAPTRYPRVEEQCSIRLTRQAIYYNVILLFKIGTTTVRGEMRIISLGVTR
jgi:hypothetical protein